MSNGIFQSVGIVLDRVDSGERDALVDVYTEDRGRMRLLARGIKDIKSKFAGALVPGSWGDFAWTAGKRYDIFISADTTSFLGVGHADKSQPFSHIVWTRAALHTVGLLTREGQSDRGILDLCVQFAADHRNTSREHFLTFLIGILEVFGWQYEGERTSNALNQFIAFHTGQQIKYLVS